LQELLRVCTAKLMSGLTAAATTLTAAEVWPRFTAMLVECINDSLVS